MLFSGIHAFLRQDFRTFLKFESSNKISVRIFIRSDQWDLGFRIGKILLKDRTEPSYRICLDLLFVSFRTFLPIPASVPSRFLPEISFTVEPSYLSWNFRSFRGELFPLRWLRDVFLGEESVEVVVRTQREIEIVLPEAAYRWTVRKAENIMSRPRSFNYRYSTFFSGEGEAIPCNGYNILEQYSMLYTGLSQKFDQAYIESLKRLVFRRREWYSEARAENPTMVIYPWKSYEQDDE